MTKSDNFHEAIAKCHPLLRQYLEDSGIKITKRGNNEFFSCINPDHEDKDPSCSFVRGSDGSVFHCFSCLVSGNIFGAVHLLEGRPLYGLSFIKETLEYILEKYDIEYDPIDLSEEQLSKIKYEKVYQVIYELMRLVDPGDGNLQYFDTTLCKKRGWNLSICRELGVGSVKSFDDFINALSKRTGLDRSQLEMMGIRSDLFSPEHITFCVKDPTGIVKGFASRFINWKRGSPIPKYKNTSLEDNPFYHKDSLLFCLDIAKRYNSLRLDIFEGYGSAVTAQQAGLKNCVAIGGTSLTDKHVQIIRDLGFCHINLVLDQDSTGSELMDRYIEKFSGYSGLQVTVSHLPLSDEDRKVEGSNDPDYFIQKYGISSYREMRSIGVFEHMIQKHKDELDPDSNPVFVKKFTKQTLPLIINEADIIERGQMITTLSTYTKIDKEDIKDEIRRLERTDVKTIKDDITRKLRNVDNADQLQEALSQAISNIEDTTSTKKDRYLASLAETVEVFDDIFTEMNHHKVGIHGWVTGYTPLDEILDGIPKPGKGGTGGVAIGLASPPQHGKSSVLLNIAHAVASNNDNLSVCYWAIDDHRKMIAYRLVAMISGVHIKKVRHQIARTEEENRAILKAQEQVRELVASSKIIFKDDKYGRSKSKAEAWIKSTQDSTGNDILVCVDSLHNIQHREGTDTRTKVLGSSVWAKSLCASIPATVIATMEMIKNRVRGEKPILTHISESVKMEFDFDTVAVVWNQAQGNYCSVDFVDYKWGEPGRYKPVIEVDIQKNKAGAGEKGSVFFTLDTDTTKLVDCFTLNDIDNYICREQNSRQVEGERGDVYSVRTLNFDD
jgi:DNA primase catalytic core